MTTQRNRDHKAEYARRRAAGKARGLTPSQARGHPRSGERGARPKPDVDSETLQNIVKAVREHGSLTAAAKAVRMAPERLRRIALERDLLTRKKGRWQVRPELPRYVLIYSRGRSAKIKVRDFENASSAGSYMAAVGRFLDTNKASLIEPFRGLGVVDTAGKQHPFETDLNALYRLAGSDDASFEQIYRIII